VDCSGGDFHAKGSNPPTDPDLSNTPQELFKLIKGNVVWQRSFGREISMGCWAWQGNLGLCGFRGPQSKSQIVQNTGVASTSKRPGEMEIIPAHDESPVYS
jgi:hypothetical protein